MSKQSALQDVDEADRSVKQGADCKHGAGVRDAERRAADWRDAGSYPTRAGEDWNDVLCASARAAGKC